MNQFPTSLTPEMVMAAARRTAVALADEPKVRHYSSATIALVLHRTLAAFLGAGSWENAYERLATDPELADVPEQVVDVISARAIALFAHDLAKGAS